MAMPPSAARAAIRSGQRDGGGIRSSWDLPDRFVPVHPQEAGSARSPRPALLRGSPNAPVRLTEDVPFPAPGSTAEYRFVPDASWREVPSGSGDTMEWNQDSTKCAISLMAMQDPAPSDGDRARTQELTRIMFSKRAAKPDVTRGTVTVPRLNERPLELATLRDRGTPPGHARQAAVRSFSRAGYLVVFEMTCPDAVLSAHPDPLAEALSRGHLAHPTS